MEEVKTKQMVLPEPTELENQLFDAIKALVHESIGITRHIGIIQIGTDSPRAERSAISYGIHPTMARLKLIKQFYFELLVMGYVVSEQDFEDIKESLDSLSKRGDYEFFRVLMVLGPSVGENARVAMMRSIIRLIEDKEWFETMANYLREAG